MNLLTWLDVERVFRLKTDNYSSLHRHIQSIQCFYDAVEIGISPAVGRELAVEMLKAWFGEWYNEKNHTISLDLAEQVLPVEFMDEETPFSRTTPARPLWQEVIYQNYSPISNLEKMESHWPVPRKFNIPITAFHSFKGGVGRTTALICYLIALLESAAPNEKRRILVIDSDLEAPGITYWFNKNGNLSTVSFISYLEAIHYPPGTKDKVADYFARELQRSSVSHPNGEIFILPAFTKEEQLLDTPILPENIVKGANGPWSYANEIHQLGQCLDADHIFVDMRAGLSEISGPLLFDPRIELFLVTTLAEQSIQGTTLILRQLSKMLKLFNTQENEEQDACEKTPNVILSLLTDELKKSGAFEEAITALNGAFDLENEYTQSDSGQLPLIEMDFNPTLMSISSWTESLQKLTDTHQIQMAREWAEAKMPTIKIPETSLHADHVMEQLKKVCKRYEFAEQGDDAADFLITEPITNMVKRFNNDIPRLVSMGPKGSGKTFCYLQMIRSGSWPDFIARVMDEKPVAPLNEMLFPLLHSTTLGKTATDLVLASREKIFSTLDLQVPLLHGDIIDRINNAATQKPELNESQWTLFWLTLFADAIGYPEQASNIQDINTYLKGKKIKIIFMIDGLEDIFQETNSNVSQQVALKTLLHIPQRISEIRNTYLGIILFVRQDFIKHSITQNRSQFEALYAQFSLSWDATSFLKLVYWICAQANIKDFHGDQVSSLKNEALLKHLERLWGRKLGRDNSNEANSARWVYAALTDFQGKLQARDIVRMLLYASEICLTKPSEVKMDLWKGSRLLPPAAIKQSLKPCSMKKIKEAGEEFPAFKRWMKKFDATVTTKDRVVPFTSDQYQLSPLEIEMLNDMGIIMESQDPSDGTMKWYMPEIYRAGLHFTMKSGARPRILALKRKALGRDLF